MQIESLILRARFHLNSIENKGLVDAVKSELLLLRLPGCTRREEKKCQNDLLFSTLKVDASHQ